MANWFLETGLYLLGVAIIPIVGLVLVCRGLWGDRSKGRPRCPNCWYDMRGSLPSLVCPECGHDARHERRLHSNRRGWRRIAVGLVVVLLSCYPLVIIVGWCRERAATQTLTNSGHRFEGSARAAPTWLVSRLPQQFPRLFDRITAVRLIRATDADLAECGKLRHLTYLDLTRGSQVTDAGLMHLERLAQLHYLCLADAQVTDAGLAHLKGLPSLKRLDLLGTQVTDAGVAELEQALPNVEVVRWLNEP